MAQRIETKRDQRSAAAEQGNGGNQKSRQEIARPLRIWRKIEIVHPSHFCEAKERPEHCRRRDQQRAMKECFEAELCERWKLPLRQPKKRWRQQRTDQNRRDEISRQSGYVFHAFVILSGAERSRRIPRCCL